VLVGMNDDREIHPVNRCILVGDVDLTLKVGGFYGQMSLFHRVQRTPQPVDYFGLGGNRFFTALIRGLTAS